MFVLCSWKPVVARPAWLEMGKREWPWEFGTSNAVWEAWSISKSSVWAWASVSLFSELAMAGAWVWPGELGLPQLFCPVEKRHFCPQMAAPPHHLLQCRLSCKGCCFARPFPSPRFQQAGISLCNPMQDEVQPLNEGLPSAPWSFYWVMSTVFMWDRRKLFVTRR